MGDVWLSSASIEERNPSGPRRGRYFCPECQHLGGRTPDLVFDLESGRYRCFKCGASGVVQEKRKPKESEWRSRPKRQAWVPKVAPIPEPPSKSAPGAAYMERIVQAFPGSAADAYELSRGIEGVKLGLGFDPAFPWPLEEGQERPQRFPAVVFIFFDQQGLPVARQGRYLGTPPGDLPKVVTYGKIGQGVFNYPALRSPWLIVCEGPNTAAALIQLGYPAIAIGGKTVQPWLLHLLASKEQVFIAFDADSPGDKAARDLAEQFASVAAPPPLRLAPPAGDWNDYLSKNPELALETFCCLD